MSFVDSGYQGDEAQRAAYEVSRIAVTVVKRTDTTVKGFIVLPKRWVVERTLGWINRARRLSKDFEATMKSSLTWLLTALGLSAHATACKASSHCRKISSPGLKSRKKGNAEGGHTRQITAYPRCCARIIQLVQLRGSGNYLLRFKFLHYFERILRHAAMTSIVGDADAGRPSDQISGWC